MARQTRVIQCALRARQFDQGPRRRISIKASGQKHTAQTGRTYESNRSTHTKISPCHRGRPHMNHNTMNIKRTLWVCCLVQSQIRLTHWELPGSINPFFIGFRNDDHGPCDPGNPPARRSCWGEARIPRIAWTIKVVTTTCLTKG